MRTFHGFAPGPARLIGLPAQFFSELLPLVDNLDELKLTLFALWALQQKDGDYRYLRAADFSGATATAMHGLAGRALNAAHQRAVTRGTLLTARVTLGGAAEALTFANSPAGRAAVRQIAAGHWLPGDAANPVQILPERPTVYRLYEENIGPLTPLIADDLKDSEAEYGHDWLTEAIELAVRHEKRSMAYVRAILQRWKREGKTGETTQRAAEETGALSGQYSDFFRR